MENNLRFLSSGDSHGEKITAILDGYPSGLTINIKNLHYDLHRRKFGLGSSLRMKIEQDNIRILSGFNRYRSTGAPILIEINNNDFKNWNNRKINPLFVPRPGHVDLIGFIKYNLFDLRASSERASARETVVRVSIGSLCKFFLQNLGIKINSQISSISFLDLNYNKHINYKYITYTSHLSQFNSLSFINNKIISKGIFLIKNILRIGNSIGGSITLSIENFPIGIGSYTHWDKKLEALISWNLLSIPSIKGIEFGNAFINTTRYSSSLHDIFFLKKNTNISYLSNRSSGINGGISNGLPILIKVALKPINTIKIPVKSINLLYYKNAYSLYQRSDIFAVIRALPICEAVLAYSLMNSLLSQFTHDSFLDIKKSFYMFKEKQLLPLNLSKRKYIFSMKYPV